MYTQALDIPDQATAGAVAPPDHSNHARPVASAAQALGQLHFDAVMDADGKIEPQDWMPEAYRKTLVRQDRKSVV